MPTVPAAIVNSCWLLGAASLAALSCQPVTRSYGSGGSGGSPTGTSSTGGVASSSSSTGPGGAGGAGTGGGDAGAPDGPVTCTAPLVACAGPCVNLGSSSTDCGACGHDCGGGLCSAGQCQPAVVYTGSMAIGPIAVSSGVTPTEVFFSAYDSGGQAYKLLACPTTGCVLAPRQLASMEYSIGGIAWVYDATTPTVVFNSAPAQNTERPALFPCPASGCPGSLTSAIADGLGGFDAPLPVLAGQVYYSSQNLGLGRLTCTAGTCTSSAAPAVKGTVAFAPAANLEYYIDSYAAAPSTHMGYILGCAPAVSPCTPTTVLAQNVSGANGFQVQGSSLYWMVPGQTGTQNGFIQSCALPACSAPSYVVKGLSAPSGLLVDADGAYWITGPTPSIQRCVGATCTGGAQSWVTSVTAPHDLRADARFVYWADGNTVYRIAK